MLPIRCTRRASATSGASAATPALAAIKPEPRPDVPRIRYDRAFLASLPAATGDAEWQCLTEALYFEARGEDTRGIFAVAEVILNRVDSRRFPDSVCSVVHQGTGAQYQCQFTYTCDGLAEDVREPRAWARVGKVARLMLDGGPRLLDERRHPLPHAGRRSALGPHLRPGLDDRRASLLPHARLTPTATPRG